MKKEQYTSRARQSLCLWRWKRSSRSHKQKNMVKKGLSGRKTHEARGHTYSVWPRAQGGDEECPAGRRKYNNTIFCSVRDVTDEGFYKGSDFSSSTRHSRSATCTGDTQKTINVSLWCSQNNKGPNVRQFKMFLISVITLFHMKL